MSLLTPETAVAVKSTTGMLTAAGVWTGVIMLSIPLLIAIVKIWPKLRELDIGKRKDDLSDLRARILALEGKVEEANTHATAASEKAHHAEMKLVTAVAAFQLVTGELRKHDPDSAALRQAQDMMAMAATGDFGMHRAIQTLATVRGTSG